MTQPTKLLNIALTMGAALFIAASAPAQARGFLNNSAQITETPLDGRVNMPLHMDFDPQGNLWVGAFKEGKMLRYTYNGDTRVYDVSPQNIDPGKGPMNLYADPRDNSVWFSSIGGYIVNMKVDGTQHTYTIPTANAMPMGVRGDSKGDIWFSEMFSGKIAVVRANGTINEYDIPNKLALPTGLTVDKYDNKWFVLSGVGTIGVLRTTGQFEEYGLPIGAHPMGISYNKSQASDLIWFTETIGNQIGSVNQQGQIKLYRIPTILAMPMMVMEDMMGDVWFTEMSGNQIGKLNVSNGSYRMSEFKIPTALSAPMGLSMHPTDGTLWFTEVLRNRLGTLQTMTTK
jgi:virginiamycin B lyase